MRTDLARLKRDSDTGRAGVSEASAATNAQPWWRSNAALGIGAVALLFLLAAAGWFYKSREAKGEPIDSIAVLPFMNANGNPDSEYLSDGITESLINSLSQLPHLKVMSRDSAFMYKGKDQDARTVGKALKVRAVLKGRVMQRGDELEISAELVDARDDSHIWGQQYSRKASDIFALQGALAKEMTSMLQMRLTGDEEKRMEKSYTANADAYQDYMKGRYWWSKASEDGVKKGIDYFQQAIAKDPNYALAYSGLSDSYALLAGLAVVPPKEMFPKAKEAALKALELDDTLAEAHASLAIVDFMYDWDRAGADREYQRAIELNPNNASIHMWYGLSLVHAGRLREAISEQKRATELEPSVPNITRGLGATLYYARQYDQSIEQLKKTLELDSNFYLAHNDLGYDYLEKSMYPEAIAEFEKAVTASGRGAPALASLAYAYAVQGKKAEAQNVLDQLTELSKKKYIQPRLLARIYVGLGDKDKAFEYLKKSYEDRSIETGFGTINVDPDFDPLRSDPRYNDLLRRMNLLP